MLVTQAIQEIRNKINDRDCVGLDDSELLSYLNEAIQQISSYLISVNSPTMIKKLTIEDENEIELPQNFVKTAGNYPLKITANKACTAFWPMNVRYFASYAPVSMSDELPFSHNAIDVIAIKLACVYATAQQQLDVTQDKSIVDEIIASLASAIGIAK